MARLQIRSEPFGELVDVYVSGEVDLTTADDLHNSLTDGASEGHSTMMVDLSEVTFIDLRGIQALVEAATENAERGVTMQIVNPHPNVERVFNLVRFSGVFGEES